MSAATPPRTDQVTRVLVFAVILVGFMAACGIELRTLAHAGHTAISLGLIVAFAVATLVLRTITIRRLGTTIPIDFATHQATVRPKRASASIEEYVNRRAQQRGIDGTTTAVYIPNTWNVIDAFTYTSGKNHHIVFTGGAISLFLCRRSPEDEFKFGVLLDHELSHIQNNDTKLLYTARAAIQASFAIFVAKLFALPTLPTAIVARLVDEVPIPVPAYTKNPTGFPLLFRGWNYDAFHVKSCAVLLAYSAMMLILMMFLYRILVHKREFWADLQAIQWADDALRAKQILARMLIGPSIKTMPCHSFLGSTAWHPPPVHRMTQIQGDPDDHRSMHWLTSFVLVLVLVSFRFGVGFVDKWPPDKTSNVWTIPLTILYIWAIGYIVCNTVTPPRSGEGVTRPKLLTAASSVLVAGLFGSLVLMLLNFLAYRQFHQQKDLWEAGYAQLIRIEQLDISLAIMSVPLILLVFTLFAIVIEIAISRFPRISRRRFSISILRTLPVCFCSIATLAVISVKAWPLVKAYRKDQFESFVTAQCAMFWTEEGRKRTARIYRQERLKEDRWLLGAKPFTKPSSPPSFGKLNQTPQEQYDAWKKKTPMERTEDAMNSKEYQIGQKYSALQWHSRIYQRIIHREVEQRITFVPPISLLILSQYPFRVRTMQAHMWSMIEEADSNLSTDGPPSRCDDAR